MRVLGVLTLTATLMTGAARASSFVVMGTAAPASTPSIVTLGTPAAEAKATPSWVDESREALRQATWQSFVPAGPLYSGTVEMPSIIALGEPLVTDEKVAAVPKKRNRGPIFEPLVIRGGIAGDAFILAKPADKAPEPKVADEPAQQASATEDETPDPPPAPDKPAAYLPPNGYGKHRQ